MRGWDCRKLCNTVLSSPTKLCAFLFPLVFAKKKKTLYVDKERRYTPPNTFVAAFHFTIALLSGGPALLTHPPVWYQPELVRTEKDLEDEELKELLTRRLRESKKQKKKAAASG